MTNAASRRNPELTSMIDSSMQFAESQWRAWSDVANVGTLYQIGFDAWKQWTELQLTLCETCLKMGALSLDVPTPAPRAGIEPHAAETARSRPKRIAAH